MSHNLRLISNSLLYHCYTSVSLIRDRGCQSKRNNFLHQSNKIGNHLKYFLRKRTKKLLVIYIQNILEFIYLYFWRKKYEYNFNKSILKPFITFFLSNISLQLQRKCVINEEDDPSIRFSQEWSQCNTYLTLTLTLD